MPDNVGSYQVLDSSGAAVHFWPLAPGTTVTQITPANTVPVAPGAPNTVVVANHGVLDIAWLVSEDAPLTRTAVNAISLPGAVAGNGSTTATLFIDGSEGRLTCGIDVAPPARPFTGTLRLTIATSQGNRRIDVPIQVRASTDENRLFLPIALIQNRTDYIWFSMQVVSHANAQQNVANATGKVRPLRDNSVVRQFNRHVPARTAAQGELAAPATATLGQHVRDLVAVPVNWPIVFDFEAPGFVRRSRIVRFLANQRTGNHNNNVVVMSTETMVPTASANLSARTFMLDPGHGIVYDAAARRCYEWFLAHRIATQIANILRTRHAVPNANISFMRTAGFGLIPPNQVDTPGAPELGDYAF